MVGRRDWFTVSKWFEFKSWAGTTSHCITVGARRRIATRPWCSFPGQFGSFAGPDCLVGCLLANNSLAVCWADCGIRPLVDSSRGLLLASTVIVSVSWGRSG